MAPTPCLFWRTIVLMLLAAIAAVALLSYSPRPYAPRPASLVSIWQRVGDHDGKMPHGLYRIGVLPRPSESRPGLGL